MTTLKEFAKLVSKYKFLKVEYRKPYLNVIGFDNRFRRYVIYESVHEKNDLRDYPSFDDILRKDNIVSKIQLKMFLKNKKEQLKSKIDEL